MSDQPSTSNPNVNVPPPPIQQGTNWKRLLLIGGGGCLLLLFLLLVGFAGCLAAFSGGESGSGGGDNAGEPTPEDIREQAVPIGETVQAGDAAWTVTSATEATEIKSLEGKRTGNFVIVDLTFTNNSNEAMTADSNSLAVLDGKGRTFETDIDASVPMRLDLFLEQVNPGLTREGRVVFEVAPDAEQLILRAGDTNPFGGENAYINLGI